MTPRFDLSILIRTLNTRADKLHKLVNELQNQSRLHSVQIIWLGDNKSMTVGEKCNHLIAMSKGNYSTFIDDDDWIASNYIELVLNAIQNKKKVITIEGEQTTGVRQDLPFVFGNYTMNHRGEYKGRQYKRMIPNHLCIWHHSLITKEPFQHINLSEDHRWAEAMQKHYKPDDIHHIDTPIYTYLYDPKTSETRRR
jgi:glycosyltransferase involved in cell wall biosynthesis